MAIAWRWAGVPRASNARLQFLDAAGWVRRLHSTVPRLGAVDASLPPDQNTEVNVQHAARHSATKRSATKHSATKHSATKHSARQAVRQQQVVDRLLVAETDRPFASYESLPALFEAPDLLTNPRMAPLVTSIDSRLLTPLYRDIDHHNGRLKFFLTGDEHKPASSFYVRSFLPHFRQNSNLYYLNPEGLERKDADGLPWQPLATLVTDVFASIGVTELRDFYTHVLPAEVGRHVPHRDRLQSGTWKVDIRWSPNWTELLFLDAEDARWYALRFPPGGSGFVIDSALFRRFHAVRAGPTIQQSVLLVFNQQGSTMQMVREAFTARVNAMPNGILLAPDLGAKTGAATDAVKHDGAPGSLAAFAFPVATAKHPPAVEALRIANQSAVNVRNSVRRLRTAVLAIAPDARGRRAWMYVPQTVVDQAVATFAEEERADLLQIFERCKLNQHVSFGLDRHSSAATSGRRQAGQKLRRVIDDRHVSIQGSATVEGQTFHFPAYDGTEATRLRFAWKRKGTEYGASVSTMSANKLSAQLAALMASRNLIPAPNGTYSTFLNFDGDNVVGSAAERLRELGLTLQVVRLEGELDNHAKRSREMGRARAAKPVRRTRPKFLANRRGPIRSPWSHFLADRYKVVRKSYGELTAEDRKAYEDKAAADKSRYQEELSKLPKMPAGPANAVSIFIRDHPGVGVKKGMLAWAQLSPEEKQGYEVRRRADLLRYRAQLREWQRLNDVEGRVKRPRQAFGYFQQEMLKPMYDLLSPAERKVYEDKARAGRKQYEEQESQWSAENQQAPTTAFEVFRAEARPTLLQTDSTKFSGREGQRRLNRELRAQWQQLSRSDWTAYERKLGQSEGSSSLLFRSPATILSASNL